MTEKELEKLELEISELAPMTAQEEREFLESQVPDVRKKVIGLMASFKIAKYLREDERMKAIHKDLMMMKSTQEWIDNRLIELSDPKKE